MKTKQRTWKKSQLIELRRKKTPLIVRVLTLAFKRTTRPW